jgi:hypothetical protein
MSWINNKLIIPSPLLIFLKSDDIPITNTELKEVVLINAIAIRSFDVCRSFKGLELFESNRSVYKHDDFQLKSLLKEVM